jgi:hypothetical protein
MCLAKYTIATYALQYILTHTTFFTGNAVHTTQPHHAGEFLLEYRGLIELEEGPFMVSNLKSEDPHIYIFKSRGQRYR